METTDMWHHVESTPEPWSTACVEDKRGNVATDVGFQAWEGSTIFIVSLGAIGQLILIPFPSVAKGFSSAEHVGAREVKKGLIDVDLVRSWIHRCGDRHTGSCLTVVPASYTKQPPMLLIDLEQHCIVRGEPSHSYVCLSYVWGRRMVTVAEKSNIDQLMAPGALNDPRHRIPATIRDTIMLAAMLGQTHLWVDSLCIIQDDDSSKQNELRAMGDIYRYASFVIVAAAGDHADHGLSGVPGGSRRRAMQDDSIRYIEFADHQPVFCLPPNMQDVSIVANVWNTRAWTLQEALFASRILLVDDTVRWICRRIAATEAIETPAEHTEDFCFSESFDWPLEIGFSPTVELPCWPDLATYFMLVESFNVRALTYDEDALGAFAGVVDHMSKFVYRGFHYGLPEMCFDIGLLWLRRGPIRRRRPRQQSHVKLPSWSWVGWEGKLDTALWVGCYDWMSNRWGDMIHLSPVVKSYCYSDNVTAAHCLERLDNSYHTYRDQFTDLHGRLKPHTEEKTLPDGWYMAQETGPAPRYRHPVLDHELHRSFCFPLPITPGIPTRSTVQQRGSLLHFDTTSITLKLDGLAESIPNDTLDYDLRTREGVWVGTLRPDESLRDEEATHQDCRLIAISQGRIRQDSFEYASSLTEWDHVERVRDLQYYEFYNVLWISDDVDGISYRQGLGRVVRRSWDLCVDDNGGVCSITLG